MRVTFTIDKNAVMTEVQRLTHYAGARKVVKEGEDAYGRMSATDSDRELLEQFWKAACSAATEQLMHYARSIDNDVEGEHPCYEVVMDLPSNYDVRVSDGIEDSLKNFFINMIVNKWLEWVDAEGKSSAAAATDALGYMQDIEKKIYFRKRPSR